MSTKTLSNDLDNCLISFDSKVLVTNLLDEYGGLLEECAKTVQEFLSAEEKKGKEFEKIFLLRGRQLESDDEVITLVPDGKLNERKEKLRDAQSMLYSAEVKGGTKSPPTACVPLQEMAIKLDSLVVKDISIMVNAGLLPTSNGTSAKEPAATKKPGGALGAMFKKQETTAAAAAKTVPDTSTPKKPEPEKKADKSGPLGAMFKKQEAAASKKSPKAEPEKKSNALGAMFKKQEATAAAAAKKSPTEKKDQSESKKGLTNFITKKNQEEKKETKTTKAKSPAPKKKEQPKIKEEPPASNVSVCLFEESESSDDEEALDALKREVLTEDEDDKPATSNKRRRIIDSDDEDEDTGPEVKIERKEINAEKDEAGEVIESDEEPKKSETFLDDDGFVVTKKAKRQSIARKKPNPTPVKIKTPSKVKKESPPTTKKKEAASKVTGPKTKQGNIMNFFTKK